MKSGYDRIGRSVSVEHAVRSCLDKKPYDSRNAARDSAAKAASRHGIFGLRPYRCTICGRFHLTSVIPYGLRRGKAPNPAGRQPPAQPQSKDRPKGETP